jgi:pseudaminic acid cytidylyltransferase
MRLAVIPARGGSKRIPRKNIREFCGKPIIARSIEVALASGCFDRVIVSTDDREIAEIALCHGAEAPFVRPSRLAGDFTPTVPVIAHAIQFYLHQNVRVDHCCCLYATAPFCRAQDLSLGLEILIEKQLEYVLPVTAFRYPIQRAVKIRADGRIEMFDKRRYESRSQDLEPAYHDAGQWYWGTSAAWLDGKPVIDSDTLPVILPAQRVCDIDTEEDWVQAELMFRALGYDCND